MTEQSTTEYFRYRIRRDTSGAIEWFRASWREKRWFRWLTILLGAFLALWLVVWALLARDLPDAEMLLEYEPPLPTLEREASRLRAVKGMAS